MALKAGDTCPICEKQKLTEQVTSRNVRVLKCKKKAEGGCGFFANLGHVKKAEDNKTNEPDAAVTPPKPAGGESGGNGERVPRTAADVPQRTAKRTAKPSRKRAGKTRRNIPDDNGTASGGDKPKRGFLGRILDGF